MAEFEDWFAQENDKGTEEAERESYLGRSAEARWGTILERLHWLNGKQFRLFPIMFTGEALSWPPIHVFFEWDAVQRFGHIGFTKTDRMNRAEDLTKWRIEPVMLSEGELESALRWKIHGQAGSPITDDKLLITILEELKHLSGRGKRG